MHKLHTRVLVLGGTLLAGGAPAWAQENITVTGHASVDTANGPVGGQAGGGGGFWCGVLARPGGARHLGLNRKGEP